MKIVKDKSNTIHQHIIRIDLLTVNILMRVMCAVILTENGRRFCCEMLTSPQSPITCSMPSVE